MEFAGASDPAVAITLDGAFPGSTSSRPHSVLHICRGVETSCPASIAGGRQILHAGTLRTRDRSETWVKGEHKPKVAEANSRKFDRAPRGVGAKLAAAAQDQLVEEAGKGARRERKRKRRRRSSSSSSGEDSGSAERSERLFRGGDSRDLSVVAAAHPGKLYEMGLKEILKYLGQRESPSAEEALIDPVFRRYFITIFQAQHPQEKIGIQKTREIHTLCLALDCLAQGRLAEVADLLMQRLKALELAVKDGNWALASQLELLPRNEAGLVSQAEHQRAAKIQLLQARLHDVKERFGKKKSG